MSNNFKALLGIVLLGIIEVFSFYKMDSIDIESFFAIWALFPFLLLLGSIFGIYDNSYSRDATTAKSLIVTITDEMIKTPKKKESSAGLFKSMNLVYLILIIFNFSMYLLNKS